MAGAGDRVGRAEVVAVCDALATASDAVPEAVCDAPAAVSGAEVPAGSGAVREVPAGSGAVPEVAVASGAIPEAVPDAVAVVSGTVAAVRAHRPASPDEAAGREEILAFLAQAVDPFDRTASTTHVTASAVVTGPRGVLLHLHKRLGLWLQPGGHVNPGELPAAAALRETLEETGVPARHPAGGPHLLHVDVHDAGDHHHLDLRYLLEAGDVDPSPGDGESAQVAWFDPTYAVTFVDGSLVAALAALAAHRSGGHSR